MDSEKYIKLEDALEHGESPSDEGPFYHHSQWEGYKGSIKGKTGGIIIGAMMGSVVGGLVAGAMAIAATFFGVSIAAGVIGATFAGIAGAGMLYGMVEFNEIGKINGVVASGLEQKEVRDAIRSSVLERKIDNVTQVLRELLKGKKTIDGKPIEVPSVNTSTEEQALDTYRKTHYAKMNGSSKGPVFWKIALIGLAVGLGAGFVLAMGGLFPLAAGETVAAGGSLAAATLGHIIGETAVHSLGAPGVMAVSMAMMGAFGASFGLNRDYFRKVFDTTDLWSKGILYSKKVDQLQEEAGKKVEEKLNGKGHDKKEQPEVATAVAPPGGYFDYPASATLWRERILKSSTQALHELDHTRATPH